MKLELKEGEHYYYNDKGYMVLTERYHLERGSCCGNGCTHCPYLYDRVPEPRRQQLLQEKGQLQQTTKA